MTDTNDRRRILVIPIGRPTFDLELGTQQVGAATAVLAEDGPIVLGVVGCGAQAVTQVHAISPVPPITRVLAYDAAPDVAGCLLTFHNPKPTLPGEELEALQAEQAGAVGDLTACRKAGVFGVPLGDASPEPRVEPGPGGPQ